LSELILIPFSALSTLEKKNKQLDSATKELEKKVKSLRQKSQLKTVPNVVKVRKYVFIVVIVVVVVLMLLFL
jgi:t-SNARE complex subunit (syntaxin)